MKRLAIILAVALVGTALAAVPTAGAAPGDRYGSTYSGPGPALSMPTACAVDSSSANSYGRKIVRPQATMIAVSRGVKGLVYYTGSATRPSTYRVECTLIATFTNAFNVKDRVIFNGRAWGTGNTVTGGQEVYRSCDWGPVLGDYTQPC